MSLASYFTIVASIMLLNFWDVEGPAREAVMNGFLSNVAIIGGLLLAGGWGNVGALRSDGRDNRRLGQERWDVYQAGGGERLLIVDRRSWMLAHPYSSFAYTTPAARSPCANTHMLASRSAPWPVSTVITASTGPETAIQV